MLSSIEQTAAQLRCPDGEAGKLLGQGMNLRNLPMIVNAFSALNLQANERVLEIGYGNGGLLGYVLSLAKDVHYTGLESSSLMHAEALAFNKPFIEAGLAAYHLYDGVHLPFDSACFDKIISINTLYFWAKADEFMMQICRALKIGGHLCLSFCPKDFMQTLPFSAYGFNLYSTDDVLVLSEPLPLRLVVQTQHADTTVSKSGQLVARTYVQMLFERVDGDI